MAIMRLPVSMSKSEQNSPRFQTLLRITRFCMEVRNALLFMSQLYLISWSPKQLQLSPDCYEILSFSIYALLFFSYKQLSTCPTHKKTQPSPHSPPNAHFHRNKQISHSSDKVYFSLYFAKKHFLPPLSSFHSRKAQIKYMSHTHTHTHQNKSNSKIQIATVILPAKTLNTISSEFLVFLENTDRYVTDCITQKGATTVSNILHALLTA